MMREEKPSLNERRILNKKKHLHAFLVEYAERMLIFVNAFFSVHAKSPI